MILNDGVGGGVLTAFSSQVLGNSDFFTGAFPAEYNNALSGAFDMALRNGNKHTAQVGALGVEFVLPNCLSKKESGLLICLYFTRRGFVHGIQAPLVSFL
ncbi:hypothetical protein FACS1894181_09590 [Bacteroidia bacterium]|nr:hypothetical protein FACS1894181_09590 [Bacteroidia bacterium]